MKKKRINYFKYFSLFFAIALLVSIAGCSGTPPAVPIINSFSASPSTITVGESSTLSWSVTDAASVTIDNGVGTVALSGSTAVNPTTITTYILTATNVAGSVTASTTVTVSSAVTVNYNGNGHTAGTVPVDSSSPYEYGATVTVLGNTGGLTRINDGGTSYRFTGWNTKADGSGVDQAEGSTFTIGASNVTLYAQWTPYVLRDTGPAGGYIFYDKGSYSDSWRYLEAAPVSTEWTGKEWGSHKTLIGGTGTGIGTGQSNTTIIVTWLDNNLDNTYEDVTYKTDRAAYLCDALTEGSYSDWFLPSKDELNLMYENLKVAGVGGFADFYYWSSSEDSANSAWLQYFGSGFQGSRGKSHDLRVRAVRVF